DEFVTARQALVKRLRSEGERDRAAEVAKLRRPTAAAWAVNQLAHRHPDELARLLELGHELHRAHERLLAGDRDDATVTSGRRRHEAIADLVDRAAGILSESGRAADAHRDAIASTLDAASLDPDVGVEVAAGRLSKELDPPSGFGLGGGDGGWSAPPPPAAMPRAASPKASAAADTEADARAERAAAERARRADEARQRATTARSAAIRARELADQARDAADRADADLERLEAEVVRARRAANDSRRAARELRDAAHESQRQAAAPRAGDGRGDLTGRTGDARTGPGRSKCHQFDGRRA
ncbi:MAG: hypothetical protein QOI56_360, partial [Actinomycetota bacterium]|nr:hypothetical protein [Actinomycetota bacterium]